MPSDIEQILSQACDKLAQGCSEQEVLSAWPDQASELRPLLDIVLSLRELPKKSIPEPAMRRKYILAPSRHLWLQWVHLSRFMAVSSGLGLLLAVGIVTGFKTTQSAPGEALFNIKKFAEHMQIQLASSQEQKITLQVQIAQKRLVDAQSALKNSQNDPDKETAALVELSAETTKSVNALDQAAKDKNSSLLAKTYHPFAASLVNIASITSQQQALVKDLNANSQLDQAAKIVLQANQENITKVAEIKKFLAAASSDNDLVKLDQNPDAITASGTISSIVNNFITIGENTFKIDDNTIIKNSDNSKLSRAALAAKQEAVIVGDKTHSGLIAREITQLEKPSAGQGLVKGAMTVTASASSSKPAIEKPVADPNAATGSFFMEDPAPLCPPSGC